MLTSLLTQFMHVTSKIIVRNIFIYGWLPAPGHYMKTTGLKPWQRIGFLENKIILNPTLVGMVNYLPLFLILFINIVSWNQTFDTWCILTLINVWNLMERQNRKSTLMLRATPSLLYINHVSVFKAVSMNFIVALKIFVL